MGFSQINIFVSSTFKDMDLERDLLLNRVERMLNDYFSTNRIVVQFIDLRQSVETNQQHSIKEREEFILRSCLSQIEACQPFFLGLIGHRYGSVLSHSEEPFRDRGKMPAPPDFPISFDDLSVTALEIAYGIQYCGTINTNCLFFLREEDSYKTVDNKNYFYETEEKAHRHNQALRTYLRSNFKCFDYSLNVTDSSQQEQQTWASWAFQQIKITLSESISTTPIGHLRAEQELFQYRRAKAFKGRESLISEVLESVRKESTRYVFVKGEKGTGRTSLLCKITDILSSDPNNICLFFKKDASQGEVTPKEVLSYFSEILSERLGGRTTLPGSSEMEHSSAFLRLLSNASHRFRVYILGDVDSLFERFMLRLFSRFSTLVVMPPSSSLLYHQIERVWDPSSPETIVDLVSVPPIPAMDEVLSLVENQRQEVKEFLFIQARSHNMDWLVEAIRMASHLDRNDFHIIRSSRTGNDEGDLVRYILSFLEALPSSEEEMSLVWISRVISSMPEDLVSSYLLLLSAIHEGMSDRDVADLLDIDLVRIVDMRQILGDKIVTLNRRVDDCRYVLRDSLQSSIISIDRDNVFHEVGEQVSKAASARTINQQIIVLSNYFCANIKGIIDDMNQDKYPDMRNLAWFAVRCPLSMDNIFHRLLFSHLDERVLKGVFVVLQELLKDGATGYVHNYLTRKLDVKALTSKMEQYSLGQYVSCLYVLLGDSCLKHFQDGGTREENWQQYYLAALSQSYFYRNSFPDYFLIAFQKYESNNRDAETIFYQNNQQYSLRDVCDFFEQLPQAIVHDYSSYVYTGIKIYSYYYRGGEITKARRINRSLIAFCNAHREVSNDEYYLSLLLQYFNISTARERFYPDMAFLQDHVEPLLNYMLEEYADDPKGRVSLFQTGAALLIYLTYLAVENSSCLSYLQEQINHWKQVFKSLSLNLFEYYKENISDAIIEFVEVGDMWIELASAIYMANAFLPKAELFDKAGPFSYHNIVVVFNDVFIGKPFGIARKSDRDPFSYNNAFLNAYYSCFQRYAYAFTHMMFHNSPEKLKEYFNNHWEQGDWLFLNKGFKGPNCPWQWSYVQAIHTVLFNTKTDLELFENAMELLSNDKALAASVLFQHCTHSEDSNLAFTSMCNYMICLLRDGHISEFESFYRNEIEVEDRLDSDIAEIYASYQEFISSSLEEVPLSHPTGYELW